MRERDYRSEASSCALASASAAAALSKSDLARDGRVIGAPAPDGVMFARAPVPVDGGEGAAGAGAAFGAGRA